MDRCRKENSSEFSSKVGHSFEGGGGGSYTIGWKEGRKEGRKASSAARDMTTKQRDTGSVDESDSDEYEVEYEYETVSDSEAEGTETITTT